jgi:hypothetical protein
MLTIGETLKREIEDYARHLVASSPPFVAARTGILTAHHVKKYVRGILFLIRGTMGVLRRAEQGASAIGDEKLAEHYREKLREERGHDRWAEHDLASLPGPRVDGAHRDSPALQALVAYLNAVVDDEPCLFLSYTLLAEYLTVLVGPTWLQAIEAACDIPQTHISVVANHVELDREHTAEGVHEIDALVASPERRTAMLDVLRTSMSHFDLFWEEILSPTTMAA